MTSLVTENSQNCAATMQAQCQYPKPNTKISSSMFELSCRLRYIKHLLLLEPDFWSLVVELLSLAFLSKKFSKKAVKFDPRLKQNHCLLFYIFGIFFSLQCPNLYLELSNMCRAKRYHSHYLIFIFVLHSI